MVLVIALIVHLLLAVLVLNIVINKFNTRVRKKRDNVLIELIDNIDNNKYIDQSKYKSDMDGVANLMISTLNSINKYSAPINTNEVCLINGTLYNILDILRSVHEDESLKCGNIDDIKFLFSVDSNAEVFRSDSNRFTTLDARVITLDIIDDMVYKIKNDTPITYQDSNNLYIKYAKYSSKPVLDFGNILHVIKTGIDNTKDKKSKLDILKVVRHVISNINYYIHRSAVCK